MSTMSKSFTLEYWEDDGWYVGRLKEVPGVFSQGETVADLMESIRDAYQLILECSPAPQPLGVELHETEVVV
jgi:predicted RNase H-like HicB family nuclease